ncbi:WD repeat-containing protein 5, partial [Coelomomyces lativittatus]
MSNFFESTENASRDQIVAPRYELLWTIKGHTRAISSVKFSPDGSMLASSSLDKTTKIWSVDTGACMKTLKEHKGGISDHSWSSDSKYLATASDDKTLRLWNVQEGRVEKVLRGHQHY